MATAIKTKDTGRIGDIPTKPVETSHGMTAKPRTTLSYFSQMALEATDFAAKLKPIEPVVFFAASTDDRSRIVLDVFVDFGYFNLSGLRIRQQPGQTRTRDGSVVDNFSVSLRGVPVNPPLSGTAYLRIHREEKALPDGSTLAGGDFVVGGLNAFETGQAIWTSYCSGQYSGVDHERAGVKRLTPDELQTKIASAISAKAEREARKRETASAPASTGQAAAIECD